MTDRATRILRFWPLIAALVGYLIAGLAAFGAVKTDVAVLDQRLKSHEQQQEQTNKLLDEIRTDIKSLLRERSK